MEDISANKTLNLFKEQIKDYEDLSYLEMKEIYISYINEIDKQKKQNYKERLIKGSLKRLIQYIENNDLLFLTNKNNDMGDIINSTIKSWIEVVMEGELLNNPNMSTILFGYNFKTKLQQALGVTFNSGINGNIIKTEEIGDLIDYYRNALINNEYYSYEDFLNYLSQSDKFAHILYNNQAHNVYELLCDILDGIYASGKEIEITRTKIEAFKLVLLNSNAITNNLPDQVVNPYELAEKELLISQIQEAFEESNLTPREKAIVEMRYGLIDNELKTLQEIGETFGMSKENARRILKESLKKLAKNKEFRKIVEDDSIVL